MKISSQYSIAVHMMVAISVFKEYKVTSEFLAKSINVNAVVVRRLMSILKESGLIEVKFGTGGMILKNDPNEITLLDIYKSVNKDDLFDLHSNSNKQCPVGKSINLLDNYFSDAQRALEDSLNKTTLSKLINEIKENNYEIS